MISTVDIECQYEICYPIAVKLGANSGRHPTTYVVGSLLLTMPERKRGVTRIELLQGTLDMLILQTLQWGPQHGHGIGVAIRTSSADALQVEHGSLYPALHRLERQGWIAAEWKTTPNKQRAKYYRLTAAGKKHLGAEQSRWDALVAAISRVMQPAR